MGSSSNLSRRALVKWGLISAGVRELSKELGPSTSAQDAGPKRGKIGVVGGRAEEELFPAKGLPGGGQLEIRLTATIYTSDPDQLEVAHRLRPFDLESWITELTQVAEKNEQLAEKFADGGLKVSANEYFILASKVYLLCDWSQHMAQHCWIANYPHI